MGAGKTSVLHALAQSGRFEHVHDLDVEIAKRAGRSISAIFQSEGEAFFRSLEEETLEELLNLGGTLAIALGGGAILSQQSRKRLLSAGQLVTLMAPIDTLVQRLEDDSTRPLLEGEAASRREKLAHLVATREPLYRECHIVLDARRSPEELAEEVLRRTQTARDAVPLGERSYAIRYGDAKEALHEHLRGRAHLIVCDENTEQWVQRFGLDAPRAVLRAGEANKNLEAAEQIWNALRKSELDRHGCVVAIGGGVVGDLAGFAAATWMRGVPFVQVPTTVLSMVDSSVGGKTGLNIGAGKNLVGAFHQPEAVFCDVRTLSTLDPQERRAGLAEVVKAAMLSGEEAIALLERDTKNLTRDSASFEPNEEATAATLRAIRMAIRLKTEIVVKDERESGIRRLLNLGHTYGHAYEAASGYGRLRHGEAVSIGLSLCLAVSERRGKLRDFSYPARIRSLLQSLSLPTSPPPLPIEKIATALRLDKKKRGDAIPFLTPLAPGSVVEEILEIEELEATLEAILGSRG